MAIGINGMGRIGRLTLRAAMSGILRDGSDPNLDMGLDIAHVNELTGDISTTAHLLEFDSLQGRWKTDIEIENNEALLIEGKRIGYSGKAKPDSVRWGDLGCDIVLECTGSFRTREQLEPFFDQGVKKVIVSAPVKDEGVLNIVMGVNDETYQSDQHSIITAASCTTNCLAPIVKVIHESIGIMHGQITTIHNPTNTNVVVDFPTKDLRRARSALLSLQPTTTGSATAIGLIFPELLGKLDGHAIRVPVMNASLTDCVFKLKQKTSPDEVNALFDSAASNDLAGILGIEYRPLVSADFSGDSRSSVIDAQSTMVTDGSLLKVYSWYDNELGFCCRMVDLANKVITEGF